jgi:hypothetical protein
MNETIQSWLAPAVVATTILAFAIRFVLKRRSGCGGGCGCSKMNLPELISKPGPSAPKPTDS